MFKTFVEEVCEEQIIKKSRFIAIGTRVDSVEDFDEFIAKIKKTYYDARHIAYAYRFNKNGQIFARSNDDGEPSGTAGKPILNVLINDDWMNVGVAVIRYFGGIKLGAGGLIRAYSSTAKLLREKLVTQLNEFKFCCDISSADKVLKYLDSMEIKYKKEFANNLCICAYIVDNDEFKMKINALNLSNLTFFE